MRGEQVKRLGRTVGRRVHRGLVVGSLSLLLVVLVTQSALAQPGALDTTFSGNGWAATDFGGGLNLAYDVAISQVDGTIVAVGQAGGSGGRFALARYQTNGALDPSFGGDGKVITNFTPGFDGAFGVAIQADGRIVAAGRAEGSGGRVALARYDTDGTLDDTFGGDGRVLTNLTPGDDYAWAVAIQSADQKIVVAGGAGGAGGRFALARYDTDGTLDASFGGDGRVMTDFTNAYDYVDAIEIQSDGRIVAAGATNYYGSTPRFALARYDTDGTLDGTFSGDGKLTTSFPGGYAWAFGVAIQDDDKIVAAGQTGSSTALARYLPNGTLDPAFSGDGRVVANLAAGQDYADEVMIQPDGKIVTVGTSHPTNDTRLALARFNAGGMLDSTFSGDGKVLTNLSPGLDWATGAALQPTDGKIVVAGRIGGSGGRFVIARYLVA